MSAVGDRLRFVDRASRGAGFCVAAGGAAVLAGWAFDVSALKAPVVLTQTVAMMPNTAVSLTLAGLSLGLSGPARWRRLARGAAFVVLIVGVLTLAEYVFDSDLHIDELLFEDDTGHGPLAPGRMAPATAFCFALFGVASLAISSTRGIWLAERTALLLAMVSGVALVGYLYDTPALYGVAPYISMAVHTAALLFVLGGGLLLSRSLRWVAVLLSDTLGGASARRLLPVVVVTPVAMGWLVLRGERTAWYGEEFGFAVLAISTIVVFAVVVWSNAKSLIVIEAREQDARRSLAELNRTLEQRVAAKTAELSANERRFRALLEAAPDAIVIVDRDGRIVLVNDQVERLFGYQRDALLGRQLDILIPERLRANHARHWEQFFARPHARPMGAGLDLCARRRDGTEFFVEVSLSPIETDSQTLVIASVRDITSNKTLQHRLQASLDEKDLLLKEVHHRVKNNLQVIASMLRLQAARTSEPAAAALMASEDRVQTIAAMHESLYRSEDLGSLDIAAYLRRLVAGLLHTYAVDSARIAVSIAVEDVRLTMDDAVMCGLVINELLSNALKHAFPPPRAGTITIGIVRTAGGLCQLEVADTGVGLPPGFDLAATRTLGLEIVRTLIAERDGTIELDTTGGTRFLLTFKTDRTVDV